MTGPLLGRSPDPIWNPFTAQRAPEPITPDDIAHGRRTVAQAWLDRHGLNEDVDDLMRREDEVGTVVATAEALAGKLPRRADAPEDEMSGEGATVQDVGVMITRHRQDLPAQSSQSPASSISADQPAAAVTAQGDLA